MEYIRNVTEAEVDTKMDEYTSKYDMDTDNIDSVRYQAQTVEALEKELFWNDIAYKLG